MTFLDSIERAIRQIRLDGNASREIANNPDADIYSWVMIIIPAIFASLMFYLFEETIWTINKTLILIIIIVVFTLAAAGTINIRHFIAKRYNGKAELKEYFRAESHTCFVYWLIIPYLIMLFLIRSMLPNGVFLILFIVPIVLTAIWQMIMTIATLKSVHQISTKNAIIVLFLPGFFRALGRAF